MPAGLLELFFEPGNPLLVLEDDLDAADGLANARLKDLFGQLFLVEGDDFLDVAHAAPQVFAEPDDLADDDGRAGDGLHHAQLTALDALGDLDLAFAGKQRHRAHLAQVHAHGVVGLFEGSGRKVELDVVGLFPCFRLVLVALSAHAAFAAELDALGVDGGQQVVQIVRRRDVAREQVVDLSKGQIPLFLAYFNNFIFVLI